MTAEQINPHIRFAMSFKYPLKNSPLISYDSHIYYIKKGEGTLVSSGKTESFSEGCVINIPAGTDYLFASDGDVFCICINYDYTKSNTAQTAPLSPTELCDFAPEKISEHFEFEDYPAFNSTVCLPSAESLKELFEKIEMEFMLKKHLYRDISGAALKSIITELLRMSISDKETDRKIDRVLLYIREHFAEDISNAHISDIFGYHPYHLNRLMKAALGTTLHSYLISYRIEIAKRRLNDTDLPVSEISRECGYNSFTNFCRDFKKRTGDTPLSYRERGKRR